MSIPTAVARSSTHEYGPLNRNALYVRFNVGAIGPTLQTLQEQKYIEVGSGAIPRESPHGIWRNSITD
ncbi:MAG: hypothetical protein ACREJN_17740 [Nitrospiraceae bacterium]